MRTRIGKSGESEFFESFIEKLAQATPDDFDTHQHPEELPEMGEVEAVDELRERETAASRAKHLLEQVQGVLGGQIDRDTLDFGYIENALKDIVSELDTQGEEAF